MTDKIIKIGGAAGAWGDSALATPQLLTCPDLDYIIYEMLAEVTMAILTRARMKNPNLGYTTDFVDPFMKRHLAEIRQRGIRVVTNAGGINPQAAAQAVRQIASEQSLDLKIAVVEGDNLMPQVDALRQMGLVEMATSNAIPEKLVSLNAYLGARPIAAALAAGADMVITGRVVDSALVLGPLMHEFGWGSGDYDRLAQGSLSGHLLECGPQSTGGLLTDWESVSSWVNMGYPIAECAADGSFVLTKPQGTDGLVNRQSVTEQILYEIGDPRAYILPDVVCDFSQVRLTEVGADRVLVENALGRPPTPTYKACALEHDGYRLQFMVMIGGPQAVQKARRVGEAVLARARMMFAQMGLEDFRATHIEVLGGESTYGPHSRTQDSREVVLFLAVHHNSQEALAMMGSDLPSMALSMAQGITGSGLGRGRPSPFIRVHSFLVPRRFVEPIVMLEGERVSLVEGEGREETAVPPQTKTNSSTTNDSTNYAGDRVTVPLLAIAYGRSGDKGNISNVGIVARHADFVPILAEVVTTVTVKNYLAHLVEGQVERFELPGLNAFNFVLHDALGGGGTASLRFDPLGKAMAQMLLDMPVPIPRQMLAHPAIKSSVSGS